MGGSGKCWTRASFQGTEGQGAALNNCQKRPAGWCSGGHLPGAHVYKMWRAGRCTPGFLVSMDTKSGGTWNALIAGYACTARTRPRGPCCIWTNGGAFLILANDVTVAFLMNACASTDQCLAEGQRAALNDCQKRSAGWCSGGHLPSGHVLKMW